MKNSLRYKIKIGSMYLMAVGMIYIGIVHFLDPDFFLKIMPPYLPWHLELVYISGFFEILLGILLLIKSYRTYAAWGLILLFLAVYPANIYLAFNEAPQKALEISPFLASWVRLPIQFVLIALAYWYTKPNNT
tara:strand:+ start:975 stop:1373 length:399 start_codon:yes stop_codon:yes gene_type:complete